MSATLLARLTHTIKSGLELQLDISRITYWLDSKTVLCWMQKRGERKQFVRHTVNEILHLLSKRHRHTAECSSFYLS
jgi:hypothetical protein